MTDELWLKIISECFFLPDDSGVPYWKSRPLEHFCSDRYMRTANSRQGLKPAGDTSRADGRRRVKVFCYGQSMRVYGYHIVWALTHGCRPTSEIDHRDRDPTNDRPDNLRLATHQQNIGNVAVPRHNTSGVKGVSWRSDREAWRAYIKIDGKYKHLGHFTSKSDAQDAYAAAAVKHFGKDFACMESQ